MQLVTVYNIFRLAFFLEDVVLENGDCDCECVYVCVCGHVWVCSTHDWEG